MRRDRQAPSAAAQQIHRMTVSPAQASRMFPGATPRQLERDPNRRPQLNPPNPEAVAVRKRANELADARALKQAESAGTGEWYGI